MALYNNSRTMHNNNYVDNSTNKVYINPNFNRPQSNIHTSGSVMHVNPRFSHLLSNVQPIPANKAKIHVNPNFMKVKYATDTLVSNTNSIQQTTVAYNINAMYPQIQPMIEKEKHDLPITNSRYSLVRQNVAKVMCTSGLPPAGSKSKNTYQVNKYKSVPLNDIKRNLDNAKNAKNQHPPVPWPEPKDTMSTNKKYSQPETSNQHRNQYKLVNRNSAPVVRNDKMKMRIETRKKIEISQIRHKKVKGNLKKNNIPCPTYRKFGKCLRQIRGKCEFLHDKKHVSICRKFIKGLCHDKQCLLSHDLTAKKMPTCYFYLQGTCTKSECPYLHVKLSEKVKICSDFLKGYCEKGSKCLLRHIQPENQIKGSVVRKSVLTSKRKFSSSKQSCNLDRTSMHFTQDNENKIETEKTENNADYRYYQEHKEDVDTSESCEIIKPMRCKLGTLPSFIQL